LSSAARDLVARNRMILGLIVGAVSMVLGAGAAALISLTNLFEAAAAARASLNGSDAFLIAALIEAAMGGTLAVALFCDLRAAAVLFWSWVAALILEGAVLWLTPLADRGAAEFEVAILLFVGILVRAFIYLYPNARPHAA